MRRVGIIRDDRSADETGYFVETDVHHDMTDRVGGGGGDKGVKG